MEELRVTPGPSVLFVEHRPQRQDVFRSYFGKRGFLPTFLPDATEALERLSFAPPDAIVFAAELPNKKLFELFLKLRQITEESPLVAVFVFLLPQMELCDDLQSSRGCRIVTAPILLRELRRQLQLGLKDR
ncbi:MAG: hypothetical protein M3552_10245 [Planctomycetota bacterium]|nr:hypothetical protein [Planctomycetaceae bacterium]MDQ3331018.1 hypothetical protein [Planctomycetota bacterium]